MSGKNRCQTNIAGVIKTEDGAEIEFDSTGFGMTPNPDRANEWSMAAAINFFTAEPRYRWLNKVIGVWSGNFDMRTGQHRYKVYFES